MPSIEAKRPPPLAGLRVVDLTQIYAGPYATYLMARAGADVVKVEPPAGETMRQQRGGTGLPFAMLNGNKSFVSLDLKSEDGRTALLALADRADVLCENFTPGVMDRLGLGWDVLRARNRRLIYACSSGYGLDGPYRDYPAMDITVQAMAGILGATGFPETPPVKAGGAICDFSAGIHLYAGVVTALLERERSGLGQLVEVSMLESAYFTLTSNLGSLFRSGGGVELGRTGNRHGGMSICPYNVYPASDGFIAIICTNDRQAMALAEALDVAALRAAVTNPERVARMEAIDAAIGARTATRTKAALFELLNANHIPSAPVRTLTEAVNDPHLHARGALRWIDHPEYGRIVVAESPIKLHGTERPEYAPSAPVGCDNDEVLARSTER